MLEKKMESWPKNFVAVIRLGCNVPKSTYRVKIVNPKYFVRLNNNPDLRQPIVLYETITVLPRLERPSRLVRPLE